MYVDIVISNVFNLNRKKIFYFNRVRYDLLKITHDCVVYLYSYKIHSRRHLMDEHKTHFKKHI